MLLRTVCFAAIACALTTAAFAATDGDKAFIKKAIKGDISEIMLGQIAQQKGDSQGVKDFGAMLVTDHTKGRDEASKVALSIGVKPPDKPMAAAQLEKIKLEALSGAAFDHEFERYMVKDHRHDIAEFEKEARLSSGETADLARQTLPTLKKHLATASSLR